jgi:phage shock protein A
MNRQSIKAVRSRAAQLRLQAMRSQLTSAFSFCLTAENALALGQVQLALRAVQNAKNTVQSVRGHLEEPNHVAADSMAGIHDQLTELERQISNLEASFGS